MNNQIDTRWARFGAYYAMFPVDFAYKVIGEYSQGDARVLDPFAGRGTSVYAAAALGRGAVGIEINPVGWIYGKTKLNPAPMDRVLERLMDISGASCNYKESSKKMSKFFKICFCPDVRSFLLAARDNLNWRQSHADRTLMSFILYYLHNNIGQGLSNQMKQTISMSPNYSMQWWYNNGYKIPPEIRPVDLLRTKIEWRYAKGVPEMPGIGKMLLGDSEEKLRTIKNKMNAKEKFSLLLTSPPYRAVVDYHIDQWLRLWVLGGNEYPKKNQAKNRGRFHSKPKYHALLLNVFTKCSKLMEHDAVVYVRTDTRKFTFDCTRHVLRECFPKHCQSILDSASANSQSRLYKNIPLIKPGERDIVLTPS